MSAPWIGFAMLPLVVLVIVLLECSRLHCSRMVVRRLERERAGKAATRAGNAS